MIERIDKMKSYTHGADIYTTSIELDINENAIIDFSSNINPYGLAEGVKDSIVQSLEHADRYPDFNCRALSEALSEYENVQKDYIFCSNGSIEAIFRIVSFLKPKNALIIAPTFNEYEHALESIGCKINYYYLKEENDFIIDEDIIDYIDQETNIVFICNPNNPTGQLTEKKTIEKILAHCEKMDTTLVIDECFMDFVSDKEEYSAKNLLGIYSNLIILKAFTKIFAMAGIRLGYCMSSNIKIMDGIKEIGPTWNVSSIAQAAGIAAVQETDYLTESLQFIDEQRGYLVDKLDMMGLKVYSSNANYIFFKCMQDIDLKHELLQYGILIRDCSDYEGLENGYYRIAVKRDEDNKLLVRALRNIL